jgi:hypothetical protein
LPPTLRELRDIPDWSALYPEIRAALQELPEKFRKVELAVASSITPLVRLAIPRIVVPSLLLDLAAAAEGDPAAIARLRMQRSELEKVPPHLLVDAIISEENPLNIPKAKRPGPKNGPRMPLNFLETYLDALRVLYDRRQRNGDTRPLSYRAVAEYLGSPSHPTLQYWVESALGTIHPWEYRPDQYIQ